MHEYLKLSRYRHEVPEFLNEEDEDAWCESNSEDDDSFNMYDEDGEEVRQMSITAAALVVTAKMMRHLQEEYDEYSDDWEEGGVEEVDFED